MNSSMNRQQALAAAEQLAFTFEDLIGTIRSLRNSSEVLTLTERQWLAYLEDTATEWMRRLNRVDMFQPSLWDGHQD